MRSLAAPGLAALGLAALGLAALGLAVARGPLGAQASCPGPVPVPPPPTYAGPPLWKADPDLVTLARRVAGEEPARAPLPGIGEMYRALAPRTVLYLVKELDCFDDLGRGVAPDWVAGFAVPAFRYGVIRADLAHGDDLRSIRIVVRHELAHLALARATKGSAPRWMQEGYAQYASGDWDWREAWRLRFALLSGGADPLSRLTLSFPSDAEGARLAYLLSYTAVHELASMGGEPGFAALFAALGSGASLDAALRRVFGITEAQFAERWKRRVSGRYGILYLLSRAAVFWVAITLALLWIGWIRRRRNRRRLERMREEERREEESLAQEESRPEPPFVDGLDRAL